MKSKRMDSIENYIHSKKKVSLKEIEDKFDISMNTVRRYVKSLLEKGDIMKVYGGVESLREETIGNIVHVNERSTLNASNKKLIAKKAAEYIEDGDSIYIDSGTTTANILDYVDLNIHLTVITNSLEIINKASKFPNINIIVSGNNYRRRTNSFVKLGKHLIVDKLNIHKAFMAATSVSKEAGVMNSTIEEYELKNAAVEKSACNFLLIDDSKFNSKGFIKYADLSDFRIIFTSKIKDESLKEYLKDKGVDLIEL